ncbi:MAG: transglycosylase SLT domain-containing protein [Pseudomonadota bacterium]
MSIKYILPIFLIWAVVFSVLAAPTKPNREILSTRPIYLIDYSPTSLGFARQFDFFLQEIRRNRLNVSLSQQSLKILENNDEFQIFRPAIEILSKQKMQTDVDSQFYKFCDEEKWPEMADMGHPINERLFVAISRNCQKTFLSSLKAKQGNLAKLSKAETEYLKYGLSAFLKDDQRARFLEFLRSSKRYPYYKSMAQTLIHEILDNKVIYDHELNDVLDIHFAPHVVYDEKTGKKAVRDIVEEFRDNYKSFKDDINQKKYQPAMVALNQAIDIYQVNKQFISQNEAWTTFVTAGKRLLAHSKNDEAKFIFDQSDLIAVGEQRDESFFNRLLALLMENKTEIAAELIKQNDYIRNFSSLNSKLKFWVAYTMDQDKKPALAEILYNELIETEPISFYSIVALGKLQKKSPDKVKSFLEEKLRTPPASLDIEISRHTPTFISGLKRLLTWIELGQDNLANDEIEYLISLDRRRVLLDEQDRNPLNDQTYLKTLIANLAELLNFKKKYLLAFKLLNGSLESKLFGLDSSILHTLFPVQYLSNIKDMEKGLNPVVILSLIRQESAFNPGALSSAGAKGLMQLMPTAVRQVRKKHQGHALNDPEINLQLGIEYFKYLLKKQKGNLIYALAAYNAGETRLKEWSSELFHSDNPLIIIESIPYKETRLYVKLILRNIFFYHLLLNNLEIKTPLEDYLTVTLKN